MFNILENKQLSIYLILSILVFLYIEIGEFFFDNSFYIEKAILSILLIIFCFELYKFSKHAGVQENEIVIIDNFGEGITLYRAKEISTDNFVIGYLVDKHIVTDFNLNRQLGNKIEDIEGRIVDLNTLSISFGKMKDEENRRVFASLNKNGLGGDNIWIYNQQTKQYICGTIVFIEHQIKVLMHIDDDNKKEIPLYMNNIDFKKSRIIGIETNGVKIDYK